MRKLLGIKLYSKNLIKEINTWAMPLIRYLGSFFKWMRKKLQQRDQRTRKLMKMHKALYLRDKIDYKCQEKRMKKTHHLLQ